MNARTIITVLALLLIGALCALRMAGNELNALRKEVKAAEKRADQQEAAAGAAEVENAEAWQIITELRSTLAAHGLLPEAVGAERP